MIIKKTFVKLIMLIGCLFFIVSCSDLLSELYDPTAPTVTGITIGGTAITNGGIIAIVGSSATHDVVITATDTGGTYVSGYQITTTNDDVPTTWVNRNTIPHTFFNNDAIYIWVKDKAGNASSKFNATARTTVAHLNSAGNDTTGNGTEANPVATIGKAKELLTNGGDILVMNTIIVNSDTSWGTVEKPITLKRYNMLKGALINVIADTLTLTNITIDGNKANVEANEALITVSGTNAKLELNTGAILQNNNNTESNGGGVNVSNGSSITILGGTITNNTASSGGGIYVATGGLVNLGSGSPITISNNTKTDSTTNNIAYITSYTNTSPLFTIKVTSAIADGTTIGLSPSSTDGGDVIVEAASSIAITAAHFTMDNSGNLKIVDDNLITDDYEIGDKGPGGGLVFYYDGKRYEVSNGTYANWETAQRSAEDSTYGGYNNWYLPSKEELNAVYVNLRVPNYITDDNYYWSSSEYNRDYAWVQHFLHGYQLYLAKTTGGFFRAVRLF